MKCQLVMYYLSLNKRDPNELNFVYSIGVIMCQHCMNSDTNIIRQKIKEQKYFSSWTVSVYVNKRQWHLKSCRVVFEQV